MRSKISGDDDAWHEMSEDEFVMMVSSKSHDALKASAAAPVKLLLPPAAT